MAERGVAARRRGLASRPGGYTGADEPERCSALARLPERGRVLARGFVENIRILPSAQAPVFTAGIVDAPAPPGGRRSQVARIVLVWNGQRRVPGIEAGTRLLFEGMIARVDGVPTIYNPRYEILPEDDHDVEDQV
ncbi:hypothetical protein ACT3S2_03410 [Arthrobacter sp. AOP36-A1-22]|uniref:hypothetical protein n=1 Tax=Arthrobacter sp. AOP36-A1-22 TaxID=3457684 RepID=UPI004034CF7C